MKIALFILVAVLVLSIAQGYNWGGRWGGNWGDRGMFRPRSSLPPLPKCRTFMQALANKMREIGGPFSCRGATADKEECKYNQMMTARNAITEEPSQECKDQVTLLLNGGSITPTVKQE